MNDALADCLRDALEDEGVTLGADAALRVMDSLLASVEAAAAPVPVPARARRSLDEFLNDLDDYAQHLIAAANALPDLDRVYRARALAARRRLEAGHVEGRP